MIAPEIERLRSIQDFRSLVSYLRQELDWPISEDMAVEDLVYNYTPEEVGLDPASAVKIQRIIRLRPLVSGQPWGIFYIEFKPGKLPITVLRRILRALVVKKRESTGDRQGWQLGDLLFISTLGESDSRGINLAHFSEDANGTGRAVLRVVDWDEEDTHFHFLRNVGELQLLRWPADPKDTDGWREMWKSAFALKPGEVAKTSKQLAVEMARLAKVIRRRVNAAMAVESERGPLRRMHRAFQEVLLHDLTEDDFADMYAQTITYGLFAARRSRPLGIMIENVRDMVPQTNPFLRDLLAEFTEVSGLTKSLDFDELGIDALVEMLNGANMEAVIADFGDKNPLEDPVVHFYELFLKEYDPKKKIKRGIFFTPRPIVSFIVRSVDELLRSAFGLEDGLADTTTWGDMLQRHPDLELPDGTMPATPFVQILDPAVGTGTFLVEVIDVIYQAMTDRWLKQGHMALEFGQLWNEYVPKHLLPRLYGFELMMAPYAIAHMKIGLKLEETGYRFGSDERLRIYLTNTLEEPKGFSAQFETMVPALAHEARAANEVKRGAPITAIIGNPPYSIGSQNRGPWILGLLGDYKFRLKERKMNLDDDYLKFLRCAEWYGSRVPCGVLGMVTNNSYLDGLVHRVMRRHFLDTYPTISVVDLHGSTVRRERTPQGTPDKNVFDIQQGVAICVAMRPPTAEQNDQVLHGDLWGSRDAKYAALLTSRLDDLASTHVNLDPQMWFYEPKDLDQQLREEYERGWSVSDIFHVKNTGIQTKRDKLTVHFTREQTWTTVTQAAEMSGADLIRTFGLQADGRDWRADWAIKDLRESGPDERLLKRFNYRPFDRRWTYYTGRTKGFIAYPRFSTQRHLLDGTNLALLCTRQFAAHQHFVAHCTRDLTEMSSQPYASYVVHPLYVCDVLGISSAAPGGKPRQANISEQFVRQTQAVVGTCAPHDLFHYLYAVLYSPSYRSRYEEFLRIDFPRIPLPPSPLVFARLGALGADLVALHLLDDDYPQASWNQPQGSRCGPLATPSSTYVGTADPEIASGHPKFRHGKVYISPSQWFDGVPEQVWNFVVGGYQVCEKWLKDRRGRTLSEEDIAHYGHIVVAIKETSRLMGEIDAVIEEHGGWPLPGSTSPP